MIYTIIVNKRSYELPKKTVAVMEAVDGAITIDSNRALSLREKYMYLHEFVKEILGEEKAKECLGSDNLDEIDLSELAITVRIIHDAYDKPITDYVAGKTREKMNSIPMDKIASMMSVAEGMAKEL